MNRIALKNVKKGQVFYECERGKNIRIVALEDARRVRYYGSRGFACAVRLDDGRTTDLFEADTARNHGFELKLYDGPIYGRIDAATGKWRLGA